MRKLLKALPKQLGNAQRSHGRAFICLGQNGVVDLLQLGSAKAMLPKVSAGPPEIVFLNTSGGLASGDQLEFGVSLQESTRALATTPAAERVYRANNIPARVQVRVNIEKGGWLDWLPQETILFNGARLDRVTEIELIPGAGCTMLDIFVLGRAAMGEKITQLHLTDRRIVKQEGRIIHHDALILDNETVLRLNGPAMLNGAQAFATLVVISPDTPDLLNLVREILNGPDVTCAVSAPPGRLVIRLLSRNAWPLHKQIIRLLTALCIDPLPRVWRV